MSPFLTYAEVMPSKPAKDFLAVLPEQLTYDLVSEPARKRAKTPQPSTIPGRLTLEDLKALKQDKKIILGLKDVQKAIDTDSRNLLVVIVHNNEIAALNQHVVALCRLRSVPHLILPRFLT